MSARFLFDLRAVAVTSETDFLTHSKCLLFSQMCFLSSLFLLEQIYEIFVSIWMREEELEHAAGTSSRNRWQSTRGPTNKLWTIWYSNSAAASDGESCHIHQRFKIKLIKHLIQLQHSHNCRDLPIISLKCRHCRWWHMQISSKIDWWAHRSSANSTCFIQATWRSAWWTTSIW